MATMTHVVKLNDKVFTINSQTNNWKLTCPDGHTCYTNMNVILHRDVLGKIQSEPITRK